MSQESLKATPTSAMLSAAMFLEDFAYRSIEIVRKTDNDKISEDMQTARQSLSVMLHGLQDGAEKTLAVWTTQLSESTQEQRALRDGITCIRNTLAFAEYMHAWEMRELWGSPNVPFVNVIWPITATNSHGAALRAISIDDKYLANCNRGFNIVTRVSDKPIKSPYDLLEETRKIQFWGAAIIKRGQELHTLQ